VAARLRIEAFGEAKVLDPARAYFLGTKADADLVLRSRLAAEIHALVSFESGRWTIRVVGSAPAIKVSGRSVSGEDAAPIGPGTVLEVGGDTLRITEAESAASRSLANATTTAAALLGKSWTTGDGPAPRFSILFPGGADGPRREPLLVAKDRIVLGNSGAADVRLDDPDLAPEALVIEYVAGVFRVAGRTLATGDRMELGSYDLRFVVEGGSLGVNVQVRARADAAAAMRTIVVGSAGAKRALETQKSEAPRWKPTSDLTRARVLLPMLAVLAVGAGGIALVAGPEALGSARTFGGRHAAAGMTCATCHGVDRPDAPPPTSQACAGCHVPAVAPAVSIHAKHSRATRPQHLTIPCTGCHSVHDGFEVVAATGTAAGVVVAHAVDDVRLSETLLAPTHPLASRATPGRTVAWPVVRTQKCMPCHSPSRVGDPARRCFADFADAALLPVLCDDEHREEPTPEALTAAAPRRAILIPGGDLAAGRALGLRAATAESGGGSPMQTAGIAGVVLAAAALGALVSRRRFRGEAGAMPAPAAAPSTERKQLVPSINASTCIGCAACVEVCPRGVLAIRDFWAEVVAPEACCGFMLCEAVCPNRSLTIVEGEPPSDRPRMDGRRQSVQVPGMFFAGDIAGAPLIKTAINDGAAAIDGATADLAGAAPEGMLDVAVVGAGPAGLSALLRAKEKGLKAAAFEKGDAAQTIQLFPRSKLVRVLPLELPVVGRLPLSGGADGAVPKEALLTAWLRLVREEGLDVRERHEVRAVRKGEGGFEVDVVVHPRGRQGQAREETVRARRVVVAVGRRGTPRGLDVPIDASMEGRIAYHLADAAALAGLRVLVSGLGDAAMEAAAGVAEQEGTPVHVAYRGAELKSAGRDQRNVRRFRDLVDRGRITVHWENVVVRIDAGTAVLRHVGTGAESPLPVDQILVFHGGTSPAALLKAFGLTAS